jgi:hypothetical protein
MEYILEKKFLVIFDQNHNLDLAKKDLSLENFFYIQIHFIFRDLDRHRNLSLKRPASLQIPLNV